VSKGRTTHLAGGLRWLIASTLASLLAVACGSGGGPASNPSGGNPPPSGPNIGLGSKASLGTYLVSAEGRTLYYFGLDLPATAALAPVSNCTTAGGCLGVWPIFHVETPAVAQGLQASDFAEFTRPDGAKQSTFKGWPLYFYAGDAAPGDTNGDNFEVWYVVRDPFYSVLVLSKADGPPLYLANPQGRAVYAFANDTVGSSAASPVSACTDACLSTWPIFLADGNSTPTGVDSTRLSAFTRPDGQMQSAYYGHPLYSYAGDTVPGDTKGRGFMGLWDTIDALGETLR
jgi:predicted lipoprotein with Yx(FWY)xxD motif